MRSCCQWAWHRLGSRQFMPSQMMDNPAELQEPAQSPSPVHSHKLPSNAASLQVLSNHRVFESTSF